MFFVVICFNAPSSDVDGFFFRQAYMSTNPLYNTTNAMHTREGRASKIVSSSSSVAVSVAGVGDHDFPLFAISCIHKHLRSASSQPGCYTVLYKNSICFVLFNFVYYVGNMLFCAMNIFSSRYFHILYPHASVKREYIF